jgi:hypothetical protein
LHKGCCKEVRLNSGPSGDTLVPAIRGPDDDTFVDIETPESLHPSDTGGSHGIRNIHYHCQISVDILGSR